MTNIFFRAGLLALTVYFWRDALPLIFISLPPLLKKRQTR